MALHNFTKKKKESGAMKTKLIFNFNEDKAQFKTGRFEIENLEVVNDDIYYDDIKVFLDGELYKGSIKTWAGFNVSPHYMFDSIINAFLRNDKALYKDFQGFDAFKPLEKLREYDKNELMLRFPAYENGIGSYNLDLATPEARYYINDDGPYFLLLDPEGGILTDMECFFESALYADLCDVLKNKTKCLYKSKNIDLIIKENGGKEKFLLEYDAV